MSSVLSDHCIQSFYSSKSNSSQPCWLGYSTLNLKWTHHHVSVQMPWAVCTHTYNLHACHIQSLWHHTGGSLKAANCVWGLKNYTVLHAMPPLLLLALKCKQVEDYCRHFEIPNFHINLTVFVLATPSQCVKWHSECNTKWLMVVTTLFLWWFNMRHAVP